MSEINPLPPFHRGPLGIGQILDASLKIFRQHFKLLLGLVLVAMFTAYAISLLLQLGTGVWLHSLQNDLRTIADRGGYYGDSEESLRLLLGMLFRAVPVALASAAVGYILRILGEGLVVQAADDLYAHGGLGHWQNLLKRLAPRLPQFVGTIMLRDLLIVLPVLIIVGGMLGLVIALTVAVAESGSSAGIIIVPCCIMPVGMLAAVAIALYLSLMLSLTPVVVIVERRSFFDAMKRAWQMLKLKDQTARPKRQMYRMALVMLVFFALSTVIGSISGGISFAASALGGNSTGGLPQVSLAGQLASDLVALTLSALILAPQFLAFTILYFDIRMRHEGYDLQRMAAQPSAPAPGFGPPATPFAGPSVFGQPADPFGQPPSQPPPQNGDENSGRGSF